MLTTQFVLKIVSIGLMILGVGLVSGQNYPAKTIRIVTSEVGGGTDFQARLIAQGISGSVGRPVIIDNRSSGVIPAEIVSKAPPDGYTLIVIPSNLWITPFLLKTSYDPVRDFSPITMLAIAPLILVVHPSLPVRSIKELIALAKLKPGEINYATNAVGGATHLGSELFKSMSGTSMVDIRYKGTGFAINDLISGQVQFMVSSAAPVLPHIKSGRLRALAVTTAKPSGLYPGLPTVAALLPGYQAAITTGILAPANTPVTIINRLNQESVRVLTSSDVKEKFFSAGSEVVANSPEEFAAFMKSDMAMMGKMIKDAGIRAD